MASWLVSITAWLDHNRKVDKPFQYQIAAQQAHTAVHRAMMEFHDEIGRYNRFDKVTADVELFSFGDSSEENS